MSPPLASQTKQVVYNAYKYIKARKSDRTSIEHRDDINVHKTVANMTGLSQKSVERIVKEGNSMGSEVIFRTPKKIKQIRKKKINIDNVTEEVLRRKVAEFYTVRQETPSINKLRKALEEDGVLKCGYQYMRQLLHRWGIQLNKCPSETKSDEMKHEIKQDEESDSDSNSNHPTNFVWISVD